MAQNTYDSLLLISTMDKLSPRITNQIGTRRALLAALRQKGRIKTWTEGTRIVEFVRFGNGGTVIYWSGGDRVPANQTDSYMSAKYDRKHAIVAVKWTKDEEDACKGDAAILNLVDTRLEDAELSMEESLNTTFFGDGTGDGGKRFLGMQAMIETSTSISSATPARAGTGTVGELSRGTYSWWKNWCSKGIKTTSAGDNLYKALTLMDLQLTKDGESWTCGFTTNAVLGLLDQIMFDKVRITTGSGTVPSTVNPGFPNVIFKNRPLYADDACPSGCIYMPNLNHINLWIIENENFTLGEVKYPDDQPGIRYRWLSAGGQLTMDDAEKQGVIYGID